MKKIEKLYCNGSSLTAGGGLYEPSIKNEYKKIHNVEWELEKDVTYPKYIAEHFNLKLIHDAECGSGAPRLIRKTYEYVKKHGIEESKKTLFIFEITDPLHRIDLFSKKINDHIIVNVRYDDKLDGSLSDLAVVHSYSPNYRKYQPEFFENGFYSDVKNYLNNFHDPIIYTEKIKNELIGLFCFLEKIGVEFFYMFENETLKHPKILYQELDKKHRIVIEDGIYSSNHFCAKHGLTIKDELNGYSGDTHPGYFGYKKFSEILINFLNNREFTI